VTVTLTDRPTLAPQARVQWDAVRGKHVLLQPESVLVLNPTAAAILDLCDGRRDVGEIVEHLTTTYNHVVEDDVLIFLQRLVRKRVLKADGS
jgi:pyrroloquinoline quinone biosynthesis protein D